MLVQHAYGTLANAEIAWPLQIVFKGHRIQGQCVFSLMILQQIYLAFLHKFPACAAWPFCACYNFCENGTAQICLNKFTCIFIHRQGCHLMFLHPSISHGKRKVMSVTVLISLFIGMVLGALHLIIHCFINKTTHGQHWKQKQKCPFLTIKKAGFCLLRQLNDDTVHSGTPLSWRR